VAVKICFVPHSNAFWDWYRANLRHDLRQLGMLGGEETAEERDDRFRLENDRVWGPGNWISCPSCPDALGKPSYHHRDAHG